VKRDLADHHRVLADEAVVVVVDLLASVVERAELPVLGEEVRVLDRLGTLAGVARVLDLIGVRDAGNESVAGDRGADQVSLLARAKVTESRPPSAQEVVRAVVGVLGLRSQSGRAERAVGSVR
jgi:hypothetical protein